MNSIKVTSVVNASGEKAESTQENLTIKSHWLTKKAIVIHLGNEVITVDGNDLKMAVDNCTNAGSW